LSQDEAFFEGIALAIAEKNNMSKRRLWTACGWDALA